MSRSIASLAALALLPILVAVPLNAQEVAYESPSQQALIEDALSAATPAIAAGATVVDWEQNVLKEGDNGWTCFPTPPQLETAPMCFDGPWMAWADAWMNKKPVSIDGVGFSYMLAGDSGASNSDPYAEGPTDDWVVAGPHLMVITPNAADLEAIPTDPKNGGPWVMWKGTPYAHVMVPVAAHGGHEMCEMCKQMHRKHKEGEHVCKMGEDCPHMDHEEGCG